MPAAEFRSYVAGLAALLRDPDSELVQGALDGVVAKELRARVGLSVRRQLGAFPTPRHLARTLVGRVDPRRVYVDASVGCGDLLLAVAQQLPVKRSPSQTLAYWGRHLAGYDLEPTFVAAAQIRLALLAGERTGKQLRLSQERVAELLPRIRVGDGRNVHLTKRATLVLNPPFGAVTVHETWTAGRTSAAAVFLMRLLERSPRGVEVNALLPDVLRSGSRFAKWRREVEKRLRGASIESVGQFDEYADVDVFMLRGVVGKSDAQIEWWPATTPPAETVADYFDISVGAVVPHREPRWGKEYPYLTARDLPRSGRHVAGAVRRRYYKRTFEAPFVAVRRTSSPRDRNRTGAVVVTAAERVAVENHLIVMTPKDGTVATCEKLVKQLSNTDGWLNERIRCRHLTVGVLKELPWREP